MSYIIEFADGTEFVIPVITVGKFHGRDANRLNEWMNSFFTQFQSLVRQHVKSCRSSEEAESMKFELFMDHDNYRNSLMLDSTVHGVHPLNKTLLGWPVEVYRSDNLEGIRLVRVK